VPAGAGPSLPDQAADRDGARRRRRAGAPESEALNMAPYGAFAPEPRGGVERAVLATIRGIDRFTRWSGYLFCWFGLALMGVMVHHVIMRYVFRAPTAWAYDMSYMLYGSMFMLGSAYCLYKQGHIRTDFLYRLWSPRVQGMVDSTLYIVLFFPAMILFLNAGWDYAARSWALGERGYMSPWAPIIYPFKTAIPVGIALMIIQGFSELLKSLYAAVKGRWP
jgi:TRAP-type mannitol/chloroaromatic compound transport system permease small subunit